MPFRARPRSFLKWTGLFFCILISISWLFRDWTVSIRLPSVYRFDGNNYLDCSCGKYGPCMELRWARIDKQRERHCKDWIYAAHLPGEFHWFPPASVHSVGIDGVSILWIADWFILLIFVPPTAALWYVDRRRKPQPGHCAHCTYNLHSNTTGICPECGIPVISGSPP